MSLSKRCKVTINALGSTPLAKLTQAGILYQCWSEKEADANHVLATVDSAATERFQEYAKDLKKRRKLGRIVIDEADVRRVHIFSLL